MKHKKQNKDLRMKILYYIFFFSPHNIKNIYFLITNLKIKIQKISEIKGFWIKVLLDFQCQHIKII